MLSEAEIIKVLKNHAQYTNAKVIDANTKKEYKVAEAIDGLLDLYNKEKEKNKILKSYSGNLPENVEMILLTKTDFERNISDDYISKDKIKEKIEERFGILCMQLGSYERDNATSELERIAGGINELRKLKKELLQEGDDK